MARLFGLEAGGAAARVGARGAGRGLLSALERHAVVVLVLLAAGGFALRAAGLAPPEDPEAYRRAHYVGAAAFDRSDDQPETWPAYHQGFAEALGYADADLEPAVRALTDAWLGSSREHWAWRQDDAVEALTRLAALGVLLLGLEPGDLTWSGVGFALLAGAAWAAYILLSAQTGRRWPGLDGLAMASVVAALLVTPATLGWHRGDLVDSRVLVLGALVGLLVAYFVPIVGDSPQWGIAAVLAIGGGAFGAWSSSMIGISTPSERLKRFEAAIDQGQILLMVDVPRTRVTEIEALLENAHPEAHFEGVDPNIPAFP